ncbi:hypothetical protein RJT34_10796 [Clitoria ternatea]|uniref:FRIGIDA-like protein n=1 Tax=Clitoria ternatea TaxID=43366 RepID=A0AAN9JIQ8_CLITE
MASLKTISAALELVEAKKESLKKAYDDLQSHSSLLSSSFPLSPWSHFDSHFTSLQNNLSQRFLSLNSLESNGPSSSSSKSTLQNPKDPILPPFPSDPPSSSTPIANKTLKEELNSLCQNMDGKGLRDFLGEHLKDKDLIKVELQRALKCASNAAWMVLDSLDGVVGGSAVKGDDKHVRKLKRSCNVLFQELRAVSPSVTSQVRAKAKRLASEWKVSLMNDGGGDSAGAMAFLNFVAAYGLLSELSMNELATLSAVAAACDELPELYQIIGLTDKVPGLVQKLIEKGKHILAVKYVFQFNLADRIPPVPILQAHVNESQKLAKRLSQEGKPATEIRAREIHALKSVIKVIENHNLESEYPRASLEQRIAELTHRKANVNHGASAFAAKPPPHQHQQSGIKRPRTSAPLGPAAVQNNISASSTIHHYQQPHFQSPSLLPENPNPYMSLPSMPYGGMMAPTPAISAYTGHSTGPYGVDGVPVGPNGNFGHQGGSVPNSSEPHVPSGYYDTASAYGGYGLQHYYGTSYPQ